MDSHFFYPTASGSLGEARRLHFEDTIVKRESENPAPHSSGQPFDLAVRSKPAILIAEDNDGLDSDSRDVPTAKQ
jgi:hypothetical protein